MSAATAGGDGGPSAGGPVGEPLAESTWVDACLGLVHQVARALDHSHRQGVVHRDVKPSNIMVTAGGRALLLDFGLARPADASRITNTGQLVGSQAYASPEQISGTSVVDARSDVYSLGVTLYELLGLRLPYSSREADLTRRRILAGHPRPPSALNPLVLRSIQTVCLTAMDPDPARRYATAGAFAQDLEALLDGRPIQARPPGPWVRARRWVSVRPGLSLVAGALVLLAVSGGMEWYGQAQREADMVAAEVADGARLVLEARVGAMAGDGAVMPRALADELDLLGEGLADRPHALASACRQLGVLLVEEQQYDLARPLLERGPGPAA